MQLYPVRHGKAGAKHLDPEPPFTDPGREDIGRLAASLTRPGLHVERVIHSGKLCAFQTAARLAEAIAPGVEPESSGLINPNDDPRAFDWQSHIGNRDILIVGHLPFMVRLVSHLVVEDENTTISVYPPGSSVCHLSPGGRSALRRKAQRNCAP